MRRKARQDIEPADCRRRFLKLIGFPGLAVLAFNAKMRPGFGRESCYRGTTRRLRWIVPNAPGGSSDTYSRILRPILERQLGVQIRIENIPGASGIAGATVLRDSRSDGRTLGILNGPGLLVARLCGVSSVPDPLRDFTLLCRIARSRHVWATGARSGIESFSDLLELGRSRPLVVGINNVGGLSFVDVALVSALLGVEVAYVSGFRGSRESSLAAVRGDVDLVALSYETIRDRVESGDLKPLLQISEVPVGDGHLLSKVPVLGGAGGVLAQNGKLAVKDRADKLQDATAIVKLIGGGRLVAAPVGLNPDLKRCLESSLLAILRSPELILAARQSKRTLNICPGREARSELQQVGKRLDRFLPIVRGAIEKIRDAGLRKSSSGR